MRSFFEEYKYLLIGIVISATVHAFVFGTFNVLNVKEKKKTEEKPVYISILKKEKEKKTVQKKKIPKQIHKKTKIKKSEKKIVKKVIKRKKRKKKSVKKPVIKKVVKKVVKKKVPKKVPVKKTVEKVKKTVEKTEKKQEIKEVVKKETQVNISENKPTKQKKNEKFSLLKLKGKESIFETGKKEPKEEKKVSEEDIYKYIRALERYLNNLARRKDLYPPMAKRLRLEGSLTVRFTLNKDGTIKENSIKVVVGSGYSILDKGAVKLIKKYVPLFAKREGKKPPRDNLIIELPITFEIIGW